MMSSIATQNVKPTPLNNASGLNLTGIHGLPEGFPLAVPNAWNGQEPADMVEQWIHHMTRADCVELREGLRKFKELDLDGSQINKNNFILPTLGPKLERLHQDVNYGRGFGVLRGLEPDEFSVEDLTMIFIGISTYIGGKVGRQDKAGNCLVHIIADKTHQTHHRHSTDQITFHTEETGEVIAWLTRGAAAQGGKCVISSAATVYNVLAATRPDLIRVLAAGNWPFAFPKYNCRSVLFHMDDRLAINFGRAPLIGSSAHPRKEYLPVLNSQQMEALNAIEAIARATEFQFATMPGDLHFINNTTVLHRRDGFVDDETHKRHLVRLRLSSDASIPQSLSREWTQAFGDAGDRIFHIEPVPPGFFPLRSYPN